MTDDTTARTQALEHLQKSPGRGDSSNLPGERAAGRGEGAASERKARLEEIRTLWAHAAKGEPVPFLLAELARVEAERDEARQQQRHAWERHAEKDRAYQQALNERDAAMAELAEWRRISGQPDADAFSSYLSRLTVRESDTLTGRVLGDAFSERDAAIARAKKAYLELAAQRDAALAQVERLKGLLAEWRETEFFDDRDLWRVWMKEFGGRIDDALAATETKP